MIFGHFLKQKKKKKKHNERIIKDTIIKDIRTLFEEEEEGYYEPKRLSNFGNNNYIEYESNDDQSRNLSLAEYFNEIKAYLRTIIINLQNSDAQKIDLIIAIS